MIPEIHTPSKRSYLFFFPMHHREAYPGLKSDYFILFILNDYESFPLLDRSCNVFVHIFYFYYTIIASSIFLYQFCFILPPEALCISSDRSFQIKTNLQMKQGIQSSTN